MDTNQLLDRYVQGDSSAASQLLMRHAQRLNRMVHLRFDPRLSARLDPSDVVQDTMVEAHRRLAKYAVERPIPFYLWLRAIAWEKLVEMNRRHVEAERRTVRRETQQLELPNDSQRVLTDLMLDAGLTPSQQVVREELRQRVRNAIARLAPRDREVIVLSHLENLTVPEIATVLGIGEQAVYSRYRRSLQRLHHRLNNE